MNDKTSNLKCLWTIWDYSNYSLWQEFYFSTGNGTFCLCLKKIDLKTDWVVNQIVEWMKVVWFVALAVGKHGCLWHSDLAKWISLNSKASGSLLFWILLKFYMKASFSWVLLPAGFCCLYYFLVIVVLWWMILAMKWYLNLPTNILQTGTLRVFYLTNCMFFIFLDFWDFPSQDIDFWYWSCKGK